MKIDPYTYVGIVGAEAAKFNRDMELAAREVIRDLLRPAGHVLVSGHSPLGGIDVWAEEEYDNIRALDEFVGNIYRPAALIFAPLTNDWATGFQPRNMQIAEQSTAIHCITVAGYIPEYTGLRFTRHDGTPLCYHCDRRARELKLLPGTIPTHVKSGGCWTAYEGHKLGKAALWHTIKVM